MRTPCAAPERPERYHPVCSGGVLAFSVSSDRMTSLVLLVGVAVRLTWRIRRGYCELPGDCGCRRRHLWDIDSARGITPHMARQQERARRTRAALVEAAAIEFAKRGYAAASVNTILEGSRATKGAMYFHFQSKEELARAILTAAMEMFTDVTDQWLKRTDLDPFQLLHGLVLDIATLFRTNVIVQAEFRLIIEPEFYADVKSGAGQVWGRSAFEFATRAKAEGLLREGVEPEKFTRVLAASLAGQRYMADLTSQSGDLALWFEEALEEIGRASCRERVL